MKRKRYLIFLGFWLAAVGRRATIFVLTDANRVVFCNNDDYSHTITRIWFVFAREGRCGCAFIGFDNGLGQGGLNTKGSLTIG